MLFKPGTALYAYEIVRESGNKILYVNYLGASFVPSIAEIPEVMSKTIDLLTESPGISKGKDTSKTPKIFRFLGLRKSSIFDETVGCLR